MSRSLGRNRLAKPLCFSRRAGSASGGANAFAGGCVWVANRFFPCLDGVCGTNGVPRPVPLDALRYRNHSQGRGMNREYHKWDSPRLGRDMELLVFGHGGLPLVVFPTSQGRFYEFEDRGMVAAVAGKIDAGEIQLYCVDSVDAESWYNRAVPPRWRIARQVQYEEYVMEEVMPLVRQKNGNPKLVTMGCSFGGYHAVNLAMRYPDRITGFLAMSGAFDLSGFLSGYHDADVYFNQPMQYLPNLVDGWYFERYRANQY